jgi:hypothetical protein
VTAFLEVTILSKDELRRTRKSRVAVECDGKRFLGAHVNFLFGTWGSGGLSKGITILRMKLDTCRQILSDTNGVAKAVERVSKESNRDRERQKSGRSRRQMVFFKVGSWFHSF